jgi:hypothetical protein
VAEGDDLARMKMPPRTKEEFAKFLPYAVALGVEKTWADAFAKVLGAAALAQPPRTISLPTATAA